MAPAQNDPNIEGDALEFIESLAAASEELNVQSTWYCVASCAFAACNQGSYVANVYETAIGRHKEDKAAQRNVLKRIKGKCINAFRALVKAIPDEELNETSSVRNHIHVPAETDKRGLVYMRNIFRADLDPFLDTMDKYWPDLRTLVVTTIYGYYQSDVSVLDPITTSQLNMVTLIPMDVMPEVGWHMRGLLRNGGTQEQLDYALKIATEVCQITDTRLKNVIPRAEDVVNEERLF